MGRFGKRIKNKAVKGDVSVSVYDRAKKKAMALDKETDAQARASGGELNASTSLVTSVHLSFILYHEFGVGAQRFWRVNNRIKHYSSCVDDELVTYDLLVEGMIRGRDWDNGRVIGLGWSDYKEHSTLKPLTIEIENAGKISTNELRAQMLKHKKRGAVETVYQAIEILMITALQDELDWGKNKLKKLVSILRRARESWDIVRYEHIVDVLMKRGLLDDSALDKKMLMKARLAVDGLM